MWCCRLVLLLALLAPIGAGAAECEDAAALAEQRHGLPTGLLAAIGRVESGRRLSGGRTMGWPWAVNAAGQGYFPASASAAIALVQSLQARGIRSIDVGCFQVNLFHHAAAFASLADAFEPAVNGEAAAHFLDTLRRSYGEWGQAVGAYHSADPARGTPYMRMVMASWQGGPAMPSPPISQVAAAVRVFTPGGMQPALTISSGGRLPIVIVPTAMRPASSLTQPGIRMWR